MNTRNRCLFSILLLGIATIFPAQLSAQTFPAILVKRPGEKKSRPLRMHELKVTINVVGNLATTTMEMTFYNDLDRVLEGRFYFPLGEGLTVSRFALDMGGKLREGVVVPKAKGRKVFESVVRSMIDPGLLEWTKGNNFKARIYPVPARGYRKILVAYEQELSDSGRGFLYLLPLAFRQRVDKFHLKAEVFRRRVKPRLGKGNRLVNFRFRKWRESWIAEHKATNYLPNKQLAFLLPRTSAYRSIVVEQNPEDNKHYFYVHLKPEPVRVKKSMPNRICLLWDASGSAADRDLNKELELLGRYFSRVRNARVDLVLFRNRPSRARRFSIRNGNWAGLKARLQKVAYDGGTSLGALNLSRYSCDEFILVSDGISNFGSDEARLAAKPVITITSQLTAQHAYLKYVAQKTGGVFINLANTTVSAALPLLQNRSFAFLRAEFDQGQIAETWPSIRTVVRGDFSLCGVLKSKRARIKLLFGTGDKVRYTRTIELDQDKQKSDSGIVPRLWAQKKIAQLDMRYEKNEKEITTLATAWGIVTRNTSLLVLERLSDYVKYRIEPPQELRQKYYAALRQQDEALKKKQHSRIELVVARFNKLKAWYAKDFPRDKPPVIKRPKKSRNGGERRMEDGLRAPSTSSRRDLTANGDRERRSGGAAAKKKEKAGNRRHGGIELKKWTPNTPYLRQLKKTSDRQLYAVYLSQKKEYKNSSAFFLDVSDHFLERKKKALALRILSNIAEMELENPQLLRILGHRLTQLNLYQPAIHIFREVLKMREEDPQSYRDLGLVYNRAGKHQQAIDMLYTVVKKSWDRRFPEIELIVLNEINAIIARHPGLDLSRIDRRLIKAMPVDIRVVLNWDADNTDMDLWVTDPNKEKCYYGHRLNYAGGRMSRDFTQGYGPEEFMMKSAKPGVYRVEVNYYGNRQQVIAGATTVQLQLFLNYGRKNQLRKEITLRLKEKKEVVHIGNFRIYVSDGVVRIGR